MKRMWIGVGLLAVLLTAGILAGAAMDCGLCPGKEKLARAGELALAGHWEEALDLTEDVHEDWEELRWLSAALSDHAVIEEVEAGFAQLAPYAAARDGTAYNALCAALAEQIEAAGKSHGCSFSNFF